MVSTIIYLLGFLTVGLVAGVFIVALTCLDAIDGIDEIDALPSNPEMR